jgi:plasmid stability protein
MPVNVSLKNVPDEIIEKLRSRAKQNHRSLQGELMAILEVVASSSQITLDQAEGRFKKLGFTTGNESSQWIRELRDAR